MRHAWLAIVLLFAVPALRCTAQDPLAVESPEVKMVPVHEEHSATRALLLSLIPGGGQVYNRQAWKIPVIYGVFAGMGYLVHYNYTRMDMFKTEYLHRVNNNGERVLEGYQSYPDHSIYSLYNSYNRNFQLMVIITVGVYALNLVDAYVFGHLFDFQVNDDLTMSLAPSLQSLPSGLHPTVGLTFSF